MKKRYLLKPPCLMMHVISCASISEKLPPDAPYYATLSPLSSLLSPISLSLSHTHTHTHTHSINMTNTTTPIL